MRKIILLLCLLMLFIVPLQAQNQITIPTEPVRWDGQSRFNVLILGMDRRPGARDTLSTRTDVVMIASFDPATRRLGIMAIPRDMHFAVINVADELVRVNTLMVRGETLAEGYGPYFAMETLQLNLGMYIDGYIAFDFEAFIDFIDLIGGVTIDVPYAISDPTFPDMNYGFDPFYISAGIHTMNGRTALKYSRTRHNDNDYWRGYRQLQVLTAVFEKLKNPVTVGQLVQNAPQLFNDFEGHLYTNIQAEQVVFLGLSMLELNANDIYSGVLDEDYSFNYTFQGETVRVPDRVLLGQLLIDIFGEDYWR